MILLAHLLFGAAIGQKISNPILAIILAFLSHYFLDFLPHTEYLIENIKNKQWRKAAPDILRVILDFLLGSLIIFIFSKNQTIIYICAFFAILPDGFTILSYFLPNKILKIHDKLHREKAHFFRDIATLENIATLKNKKISNFWRIISQAAVIVVCIVLLRS